MKRRAGVFEDDLSDFTPHPREETVTPEDVRRVSETARFTSREPGSAPGANGEGSAAAPAATRRPPRRYRTGRNRQINIKASEETVEELYNLSDDNGWVLGETLERALAALRRELAATEDAGADTAAPPRAKRPG